MTPAPLSYGNVILCEQKAPPGYITAPPGADTKLFTCIDGWLHLSLRSRLGFFFSPPSCPRLPRLHRPRRGGAPPPRD